MSFEAAGGDDVPEQVDRRSPSLVTLAAVIGLNNETTVLVAGAAEVLVGQTGGEHLHGHQPRAWASASSDERAGSR